MQISVAHSCERPAANAQSHSPATWEWLIRPFYFKDDFRCRKPHPSGLVTHHRSGHPERYWAIPFCCDVRARTPLLSRTGLDTGMGFVWDEPTQRPYLRGHASVTLYLTPSLWKINSRSGLRISNSPTPNSRKPSIIAEQISSFSGLGFFSRLTSVFLRSACLAFFAPAWSSLGSSNNFAPRSISLSSSISSIASSRLMFSDFISFWIFSSNDFIPFLYHYYSTDLGFCQVLFLGGGDFSPPLAHSALVK